MRFMDEIIICFDTNIYYNSGYNFNNNSYLVLKDLKKKHYPNLSIYIDPIIYMEVLKHLDDRAQESEKKLKDLKKYCTHSVFARLGEEINSIGDKESIFSSHKKKFIDFLTFFSGEVPNEDLREYHYDIGNVLNDYFSMKPPFEDEKNKKNEFPDALIVQNLKVKYEGKPNLIVVSNDKGFRNAIKIKLPQAQIFEDISSCINHLNSRLTDYGKVMELAQEMLSKDKHDFCCLINNLIKEKNPYSSIDNSHTAFLLDRFLAIEINDWFEEGDPSIVRHKSEGLKIVICEIGKPMIKVLDINNQKKIAHVELVYELGIDLFCEGIWQYRGLQGYHNIECAWYVELNYESDKYINKSPQPIRINQYTRDWVKEFAFDSHNLVLTPKSETYTFTCEKCGGVSVLNAPSIDEFSISSEECSMGTRTYYELKIENECEYCKSPYIVKVNASEYPIETLEYCDSYCEEGGEISGLDFDLL